MLSVNVGFEESLAFVLRMEGGLVNDPNDTGGLTNKGITQRVYDVYRMTVGGPQRSVRDITDDEVHEVYYSRYWAEGNCDSMCFPLSLVHFDSCVNAGVQQSNKLLQRALNVESDGMFGPQTRAAIKLACKDQSSGYVASSRYMLERVFFYDSLDETRPENTRFLTKLWLKRIRSLYKEIDKLSVSLVFNK